MAYAKDPTGPALEAGAAQEMDGPAAPEEESQAEETQESQEAQDGAVSDGQETPPQPEESRTDGLVLSGGRYLEITATPHAREALEETAALGAVHFVYTHRGRTTAPVLEHLGLDRFFKEVVSSLNGFPRKPAPDALLYLMKQHGLEKDRVYYAGDRTLDVDCGKNAGVQSVLYAPSGIGAADYVIRDLLEVRDIATE